MRLLKTMQNQYLSMNAHNQRIYDNFLRSINIGLGIVDPIDTLLDDLKDKTQRFESKKMDDRLYSAFIDGVIDHLDKYNYDQRIIQFIVDKLKYFLSEDSHFNSRILYLNLVYLYEKTNKINDAFDVVKRALERFPYFWAAQHFYARMSMQYENDIEKAISLFEIIYKQENLEPSFMPTNQQKARAYFGSAICYYNDAKIDESISFARKAIAADASYAPAYSQLAKCYASLAGMKQGDPSQINLYRSLAEDNFERARQLDPVRFERLHGKRREIAEESSSVSTATTSTSATATTFVANFDDLAAWPPLGAAQKTQPVVPASEEPPVAPTNLSTTSLLSENNVEATVAAEQVTRKERRKKYNKANPNIEPPKTAKKVAKAKKPKKEKEVLPNNPVTPPGFFSSAYSFFANSATYFSRVVSSAIEPILGEFELYPFRQDGENISRGDESPKAYKRG